MVGFVMNFLTSWIPKHEMAS